MTKIAVITAILEDPINTQQKFNEIVSSYQEIIRGRMGMPFHNEGISVITIVAVGLLDDINSLTGKIGNIKNVSVKTSISKKTLCED